MGAVEVIPPFQRQELGLRVIREGPLHLRYPEFGAKGDGSADDGPAIREATNKIEAAGGGTLIVDPGVYAVDPANPNFMKPNVSYKGFGKGSVIQRFGDYDKTEPNQRLFTTQVQLENVSVEDLTFDGRFDALPYDQTEANGTQAIGGLTYLNGAQDLSGNVTVYDNSFMPASGQVVVGTTRVNYTSKSGTTILQGCDGPASTVAHHTRVSLAHDLLVDDTTGFPDVADSQIVVTDDQDEVYALTYEDIQGNTFKNCWGGGKVVSNVLDNARVDEILENTFIVGLSFIPLDNGDQHSNIRVMNCVFKNMPGAAMYMCSVDHGFVAFNEGLRTIDRGGLCFIGGNTNMTVMGNDIFANDDNLAIYSSIPLEPKSKNWLVVGNRFSSAISPGQRASNNNMHIGGIENATFAHNLCEYPGQGITANKANFALHQSENGTPKNIKVLGNDFGHSDGTGGNAVAIADRSEFCLVNGLQNLAAITSLSVKNKSGEPLGTIPTEEFPDTGWISVGDQKLFYTSKTSTADIATFDGIVLASGSGNAADGTEVHMMFEDILFQGNVIHDATNSGINIGASVLGLDIDETNISNVTRALRCTGVALVERLNVTNFNAKQIEREAIATSSTGFLKNFSFKTLRVRNTNSVHGAAVDAVVLSGTGNGTLEDYTFDSDPYWYAVTANKPRHVLKIDSGITARVSNVRPVSGSYVNTAPVNWTPETTASTAAMPVPLNDMVLVTGTANITSIAAGGVPNQLVTYVFSGTAAGTGVTDGSNLKLNGNFVYTPDDSITLRFDGTNWVEQARSVN